jgi:hypothetical protein
MTKSKPPPRGRIREVNRTGYVDPRAEPSETMPPVSGPTPAGRAVTHSARVPRRGSSAPETRSTTPPADYPELARFRRDVDLDQSTEPAAGRRAETIERLRAQLHAAAAAEEELRARTIERDARIAELEDLLERQERQNRELRTRLGELEALRDSVEQAMREIAELRETLRRERAEKRAVEEAAARLQRLLAARSKPKA